MNMKISFHGRLVILVLLACAFPAGCSRGNGPEDSGSLQLAPVSGQNQSGAANAVLQNPVVVRLQDDSQNPVGGERIFFRVVAGGGSVDQGEAATDGNGEASVAWRIGVGPDQILKASLTNDDAAAYAVYIYANSRLSSAFGWTQGIDFFAYGRKYDHDNRILESPHFLVFSDSSSDDARVVFSKMAEESLAELLQTFAVASADDLGVHFADRGSKIKVYSIKDAVIDQVAFRFGYLLYGHDSANFRRWGGDDFWLRREIKHETTHVMQWLFGLDPRGTVGEPWPEVWFTEGFAEYASGGAFPPISNLEQWEDWCGRSDHGNPVAIHQWGNFPVPYERTGEYYPAFSLAVRYLLDSRGAGRTLLDVKAMFADMVNEGRFAPAFARTFGMTVDEYEQRFPDLIADYLRRTGTSAPLATSGTISPLRWTDGPPEIRE